MAEIKVRDLPPEASRDDIDRLAYRLWSIHPKDIPAGMTRARFYADEIRKTTGNEQAIIHREAVETSPGLREALLDIEADLVGVARYRNWNAFPVVVSMCKKAANKAAQALGRRVPFDDPYEKG